MVLLVLIIGLIFIWLKMRISAVRAYMSVSASSFCKQVQMFVNMRPNMASLKHFITTSMTRKHYHSARIHYIHLTVSNRCGRQESEWKRRNERHNFYSKLLLICTCFIVAAWNCFFSSSNSSFVITHPMPCILHSWRMVMVYTYEDVRCKQKNKKGETRWNAQTNYVSIEQNRKTKYVCECVCAKHIVLTSSNIFKFILIFKDYVRVTCCNCFDLSDFWNSNFMHQPWYTQIQTYLGDGIPFSRIFSAEVFIVCFFIMHFCYKIYEWTTLQFRCCSSCALVSNCAKQLQKREFCIRKIDGNPKLLLHLVSSLQTIKFKQNFRSSKMHFIILIFRIFGQRISPKMCHQTTIVLKCCISIAAKSNLAMKVQLCIYFWLAR